MTLWHKCPENVYTTAMEIIYVAHHLTPLGAVTLASDGSRLCGLWFDGQRHDRATLTSPLVEAPDLPVFEETRSWLSTYFTGQPPDFTPPLLLTGTPFRQQIMGLLLTIPFGQTTTYGALARELAHRQGRTQFSAQAVGGAVGHNPISIIVPCHRVIGPNGTLTGYAGGMDRKEALLRNERISCRCGGRSTDRPVP